MSTIIKITDDGIAFCAAALAQYYPEHTDGELRRAAAALLKAATLLLCEDPATYLRPPNGQFRKQWAMCLRRAVAAKRHAVTAPTADAPNAPGQGASRSR